MPNLVQLSHVLLAVGGLNLNRDLHILKVRYRPFHSECATEVSLTSYDGIDGLKAILAKAKELEASK